MSTYNCTYSESSNTNLKFFISDDVVALQEDTNENQKLLNSSSRPLKCPHDNCNKNISILNTLYHFCHEHPEIPIIKTLFEEEQIVIIQPEFSIKESISCLAILTLDTNSMTNLDLMNKKNIVFLLLATKLKPDNTDSLPETETDDSQLYYDENKYFLWIAINIPVQSDKYSFTLNLHTHNKKNIIGFSGPILQAILTPEQLNKKGQGMIITATHYRLLTENSTVPINLSICIIPNVKQMDK